MTDDAFRLLGSPRFGGILVVADHASTIVFVNNRRLAERLALRLNDLAEE